MTPWQAKALVGAVPGLACVETVDSEKLATVLDRAWDAAAARRKLDVFVQVRDPPKYHRALPFIPLSLSVPQEATSPSSF